MMMKLTTLEHVLTYEANQLKILDLIEAIIKIILSLRHK